MSFISKEVNSRFGNSTNFNPVFESIIKKLEAGELYTSNLVVDPLVVDPLIIKAKSEQVFCYVNPVTKTKGVVALDVLVDAISRSILETLQSGYSDISDAASNISYKLNPAQELLVTSVDLKSAKDINQALLVLAQEISTIKSSLGLVAPIPLDPLPLSHSFSPI